MRKRRLNSGYSGNVDNRRNIKGCLPASKHYMERVLGRLDSLNYFLLDSFPGVSVAYSLRSLDGNFENPVVQVRRSSDNAESNFTAQEVSDGTLEAWCGGGDGYVSIWYDQSGNGKNAIQGTAGSQPQIVSMGVLNKENGNPCLTFDGVNDHLQAASVTLPAHVSCMVVSKSTRTGTNLKFFFEHSPSIISSDGMYFNGTYAAAWNVTRSGSFNYGPSVDNTDWTGEDQVIASLLYNGHGYIYKNSQFVSNVTATGTSRPNTNVTDTLNIGSRNGSSFFLTSNMQEILIYPAMTPERMRLIETDMNLHYNVYDASTLLGQYSGAAAAYSLRKVSYTNDDVYVVRVRRSITNEERDFLSSEITDGTLETWCDSGDGFVSVWYDQSGNNRDASQATAASQPKIVRSGMLVLENGLPAMEFDGSNDRLDISSSLLGTGAKPATVICLINLSSLDDAPEIIEIGPNPRQVSPESTSGYQFIASLSEINSGMYASNIGGNNQRFTANGTISKFTPYVLSFIISASAFSSSNPKFFRDGQQQPSTQGTGTSSPNLVSPQVARIGANLLTTPSQFLNGTMAELIIYPIDQSANRIAIEDNINEYYDIFDRTALLLHMDGPDNSTFFYDSSRNGHPITVNGDAKISTNQSKFGGSSAYFDGTGDYLTLPYSNDRFDWWTTNFTFETWIYPISLTGWSYTTSGGSVTAGTIIGNATPDNFTNYWSIGLSPSGYLIFYYYNGSPVNVASSSGQVQINTWTHIAVTQESGIIRLYVNGVNVLRTSVSGTPLSDTGTVLTIGQIYNTSINGYIDELKIVKGKALYTGSFTPPQAPFNDDNYTSLLLHMDGTNGSTSFVDSSSNAHTITANGNAQISTAQSKFGGASAAFDGTGDYLSVPDDASLWLGGDDFTIEFWVNLNTSTSGVGINFISQGNNAFNLNSSWFFLRHSTNKLRFITTPTGSSDYTIVDSASNFLPAVGQWYHLAAVRNGATLSLYVNGVSVASGTNSTTFFDSTRAIGVGASSAGETPIDGYIDDLRITKGVARYTGNFIPPTAPHPDPVPEDPYFGYVSLLLPMDDGFVDKSFRRHIVTANGDAAISTAQSKFGGASAAFDGTGDWLSIARNAAFIPTTGDFTIEAWVYPNSLQQAQIVGLVEAGVAADWTLEMRTDGTIGFFIGSTSQTYYSTATYQSGQWNHVMVCRSGSTLYIGINGVVNSTTATGSLDNGQSYPLTIGADQNGDERLFNGYIDDLRITKGVARYTGNFTPPTIPHPIP